MKTSNPWFRMYHEFASDPKVQSMPESMQRRLVMLFCFQCAGTVGNIEEQDLAFAFHISLPELSETKELFLKKKFIKENWELRNWNKRQYKSDSATPRTKAFRERNRTFPERSRNVLGTAPESESESESEAEEREREAPALTSEAPAKKSDPIPIRNPIPPDAEKRIRVIADAAPDQQDHETGVRVAVQELISSANPIAILAAIEENIPLWWEAMRDGRARIKLLRFVIADRDYLRRPREPTSITQQKSAKEAVWDRV